ncbi:MAG: reverse transcriptase domain-containing protein [Nitrospirota bacterium]
MRSAKTVLNVIRDRGKRGLPLDDIYRQLFNPSLYLLAYGRIYRNDGAMTKGATEETVDGMSLEKIGNIIELLRYERYRWTPVRRTEIPKKNGKTRPLGIPTWSDKLLQEVIRLILEAYYEPQFSDSSHGFRPQRGCHTALQTVQHTWKGTKWFIEGDIRGCFDNIDHEIMMSILRERIEDNRFLRLMKNLLEAGYLEQWDYKPTLSGVPQGGIVSPILTNIYLDRLDKYVEQTLIPEYTRGDRRGYGSDYTRLVKRASYLRKVGRFEKALELRKQYQRMPSKNVNDPGYRRLRYVRYADDFLLGFIGSADEAREIKDKLEMFMRDNLNMELSGEKTLITHARTHAAKFLGYEVIVQHEDSKHTNGRRSINGYIGLRVPESFIRERCARYMRKGKVIHRLELVNCSNYAIVYDYQSKYRGYVQYYKLAVNLSWLNRVHWIMQTSLFKTLACKHKSSVSKMARKYVKTVRFPHGLRRCVEVIVVRKDKKPLIARFGGLSRKREDYAVIADRQIDNDRAPRCELLTRLLADRCEICGATSKVEVHHVRALKDLKVKGKKEKPLWMQTMSALKRKTLIVCRQCHRAIHSGKPLIKPKDTS